MSKDRPPRVYVVQQLSMRNRQTGEWQDKFDMSPAEEYGRLVFLLPPGNVTRDLTETMARLRHRLSDFSAGDYLLASGDPVAIAAAVLVLSDKLPENTLRLLKWDRLDHRYYPYAVEGPNNG